MPSVGIAFSSRGGFAVADLQRFATTAEGRGFDGVYVSERSSDAIAIAQAMAAVTERIAVGTAIANIHIRHPGLTALAVATADEACRGRFVLGLGTGNPRYNHRAFGLDTPPPLTAMEEYVEILRRAWSGEPVSFDGSAYQLEGFDLHRPPLRADVPIHIGAILPGMLALAGRLADGAIFALQSPSWAERSTAAVRDAAEGAGRDPDDVTISCLIPCCVTDDPDVASRSARQVVAGYSLHPSASRLFADMGHGDALARVAAAMHAGDVAGAVDGVPDGLADQLVIHGSADRCHQQLRSFRDAGVDQPILFPNPLTEGGWEASVVQALGAFAR